MAFFLLLILGGFALLFLYFHSTAEQIKRALQDEAARNRKFRSLLTVSLKRENFPEHVRNQAAKVAAQHGFEAVVAGLERDIGIERESATALARELTSST